MSSEALKTSDGMVYGQILLEGQKLTIFYPITDNPYKCPVAGCSSSTFKASKLGNLKTHLKEVHGISELKDVKHCLMCDSDFDDRLYTSHVCKIAEESGKAASTTAPIASGSQSREPLLEGQTLTIFYPFSGSRYKCPVIGCSSTCETRPSKLKRHLLGFHHMSSVKLVLHCVKCNSDVSEPRYISHVCITAKLSGEAESTTLPLASVSQSREPLLEGQTLTFFYPASGGRYKCPVDDCTSSPSNFFDLKRHLDKVHHISGFTLVKKCIRCNSDFQDESYVTHVCRITSESGESVTITHNCDSCDMTFDTPSSLRAHKVLHSRTTRQDQAHKRKRENHQPSKLVGKKIKQAIEDLEDDDEDMDCSESTEIALDFDKEDAESFDELINDATFNIELDKLKRNLRIISSGERKWEEFESVMEDITKLVRRKFRIDKSWYHKQDYSLKKGLTKDKKKISRLYQKNPGRVYKNITKNTPLICKTAVQEIQDHFSIKFKKDANITSTGDYYKNVAKQRTGVPVGDFSTKEVRARLNKCRNTAPGFDKLQFNHWKEVDPYGEMLTLIFNTCLKHGKIPSDWKRSKTLMFAKKDDPASLKDWRLISLSSTIYKLYSALLSDRLNRWCIAYDVIDLAQKGGSHFDLILEHTYVIDKYIRDAKLRHQLHLVFLDIIEAYYSVPVIAVLEGIDAHGAGGKFKKIINDMLEGRSTDIISGEGTTDEIDIEKGLLPGDPLSNALFNLVLNGAIRTIKAQEDQGAKKKDWIQHTILAGADDVCLMSHRAEHLQYNIDLFSSTLSQIGLSLSSEKSASLTVSSRSDTLTGFKLNNMPIKVLGKEEHHRFLGLQIGLNKKAYFDGHAELKTEIDDLMISDLGGAQKLNAFRTFIASKTIFSMRHLSYSFTSWKNLDKHVKKYFKKGLNISDNTPDAYYYGPRQDACMAINRFRDDFHLEQIASAYKLFTSRDPIIRRMVLEDLKDHNTGDKESLKGLTDNGIVEYLFNEDKVATIQSSILTKARAAMKFLHIVWQLDESDGLGFKHREEEIEIPKGKTLMWALRYSVRHWYTIEVKKGDTESFIQKESGKSIPSFALSSFSYAFMNDCTNEILWKFIHSSRLNNSSLKGNRCMRYLSHCDAMCRKCEIHKETDYHVLDGCKFNLDSYRLRHNGLQDKLKNEFKKLGFDILLVDQPFPGIKSNDRPDLLVAKGRQAYAIDVTVPHEYEPDRLFAAAKTKNDHYRPLTRAWLEHQKAEHRKDPKKNPVVYEKAEFYPFIIGSRGSWFHGNDTFLMKVFSSPAARKAFSIMCVYYVMNWAEAIVDSHKNNREIYLNESGWPRTRTTFEKGDAVPSNANGEDPVPSTSSKKKRDPVPSTSSKKKGDPVSSTSSQEKGDPVPSTSSKK